MSVGRLRRLDDLLVRGIEPAVADVPGDGAGEQQRLLEHEADLAAQRAQGQAADVVAVE